MPDDKANIKVDVSFCSTHIVQYFQLYILEDRIMLKYSMFNVLVLYFPSSGHELSWIGCNLR